MWVFVNMGLLSWYVQSSVPIVYFTPYGSSILAITVTVVVSGCHPCLQDEGSRMFQYMFQDGLIGQFYTAAPGAVIAKCQCVSFALRIH
jgi:hypothetical protein